MRDFELSIAPTALEEFNMRIRKILGTSNAMDAPEPRCRIAEPQMPQQDIELRETVSDRVAAVERENNALRAVETGSKERRC
jgi:hypothetical protein